MQRDTELDRELERLREELGRHSKLVAMEQELDREQAALLRRKTELGIILSKEEADVDALEGMSLTALWQTVLGRREEQLEKERLEAMAARANYQSASQAYKDVLGRLREVRSQLRALDGMNGQYQKLLEEKRRRLSQQDPALGDRIAALEEKLAACQTMLREVNEAVSAGRGVTYALSDAADELSSAKNWGIYDMLGGGLVATAIKHSHVQTQLSCFRAELADVEVTADLGVEVGAFQTFADYFFDGLFFDWMVQSKIKDSQYHVEYTRSQVEGALHKLDQLRAKTQREAAGIKQELQNLTEAH